MGLDIGTLAGGFGAIVALASAAYLGISRGRQDEVASLRLTMATIIEENNRLRTRINDLEEDRDKLEGRAINVQELFAAERQLRWKLEARVNTYFSHIKQLIRLLRQHEIEIPENVMEVEN